MTAIWNFTAKRAGRGIHSDNISYGKYMLKPLVVTLISSLHTF